MLTAINCWYGVRASPCGIRIARLDYNFEEVDLGTVVDASESLKLAFKSLGRSFVSGSGKGVNTLSHLAD